MDNQSQNVTIPNHQCDSRPAPPETRPLLTPVALLIPCFNASKSAFEVIQASAPYTGIRLAVNDGSTDDTAQWLETSGISTIGWPDNRGKGYALVEGMRALLAHQGWNVLITIDSDGQHNPTDIPELINTQIHSGADIIVGARDLHIQSAPWIRRLANRLSSWLIRTVMRIPLPDIQCGYRLYTRHAVETLIPYLHGGTFELETDILLLAHQLGLGMTHTLIQTTYTAEASNRSAWRAFRHSRLIFQVCVYHLFVRRLRLGGKPL